MTNLSLGGLSPAAWCLLRIISRVGNSNLLLVGRRTIKHVLGQICSHGRVLVGLCRRELYYVD